MSCPDAVGSAYDVATVEGSFVRYATHELIAERPLSVGELSDRFPMSRWAVQKHISVPDGAALITRRRFGRSCLIGRPCQKDLSES